MNGIERLSNMLKGQKEKYLIKVVNYLKNHVEMYDSFLNEEKNLDDLNTYIRGLAEKQKVKGVAVIEDDEVYQWSMDYFNKSNEELGIKKIIPKVNKTAKKQTINAEDEFGSIFGDAQAVEVKVEKKNETEQISLF